MGSAEYAPAEHKVNRRLSMNGTRAVQQNRHGPSNVCATARLTGSFSQGSAEGGYNKAILAVELTPRRRKKF